MILVRDLLKKSYVMERTTVTEICDGSLLFLLNHTETFEYSIQLDVEESSVEVHISTWFGSLNSTATAFFHLVADIKCNDQDKPLQGM